MTDRNFPVFEEYRKIVLFKHLGTASCPVKQLAEFPIARNLASYLFRIGCRSLIVETHYIDNDYLTDYSAFYVQCTSANYPKYTKRIHFFSSAFASDFLDMSLDRKSSIEARQAKIKELQDSYLGFVVARPLPESVIGRTVLKPYPVDDSDMGGSSEFLRNYTCLHEYEVSLFGIGISIRGLGFQMQDTIAACGTTALWSTFHASSRMLWNPMPSPSEITRAANEYGMRDRPIPSRSLSVSQFCHALIEYGVTPYTIEANPEVPIASLAYAYLREGFPISVILNFRDNDNNELTNPLHVVAISGYRLHKDNRNTAAEARNIPKTFVSVGRRVTTLYAHDSHIGPYSWLAFENNPHFPTSDKQDKNPDVINHPIRFNSNWQTDDAIDAAMPEMFIVGLPKLITVPFEEVFKQAIRFHRFLGPASLKIIEEEEYGLFEWEIWLSPLNRYKTNLISSRIAPNERRRFLYREDLPKYLWVVRCLDPRGQMLCDLIIDATDVEREPIFIDILWRLKKHKDNFKKKFTEKDTSPKTHARVSYYFHGRFNSCLRDIVRKMSSAL